MLVPNLERNILVRLMKSRNGSRIKNNGSGIGVVPYWIRRRVADARCLRLANTRGESVHHKSVGRTQERRSLLEVCLEDDHREHSLMRQNIRCGNLVWVCWGMHVALRRGSGENGGGSALTNILGSRDRRDRSNWDCGHRGVMHDSWFLPCCSPSPCSL